MKKRRAITLLEVLISMALVILCALPLVTPHVAIHKEQKKYLEKVKQDYKVQEWFATLYEKMLRKEFAWEEINEEPKEAFPGATYAFRMIKKKGTNPSAYFFEVAVSTIDQTYRYHIAVKHEEKKENSNPH